MATRTRPVAVACAAAAAAVTAYQLSRPGLLVGVTPDVSAWLGGSVRLVHGAVPYRDFGFTQPPGFALLVAPIAFLSELIGTRDALVVLRLLTPLLAAANVLLVGRLTGHQGRAATLVACAVMALFPAELYAIRGPQIEPVLTLACLAGASLVFEDGEVAGRRRLVAGGVAFGIAAAIKIPALIPVAVIVFVFAPQARHRLAPFIGGVAGGFAVPVLPFFVLAPASFVQDVIGTQLGRIPASGRVPIGPRLGDITGASAFGGDAVAIAVATGIVGVVIIAFAATRRRPTPFEWFVLGSTAAVVLAQLGPAWYYPHYAAFVAPFLALLLGVSAGRLSSDRGRLPVWIVAGGVAAALMANQLVAIHDESVPDVAAAVDAVVPAGGCALSDSPALLVTSDRFVAAAGGCTTMTDPQGTTLALGPDSPASAGTWRDAFAHADYVVTENAIASWSLPSAARIPDYVAEHFRRVSSGVVFVYVRNGFPGGAGLPA